MRGPLIFIMIFYSLVGFILSKLPIQSEGAVLLGPTRLEDTIFGKIPGLDTSLPIANEIFTTLSIIGALLTFRVPEVPTLINLLIFLPAALVVTLISVQFVRGTRN